MKRHDTIQVGANAEKRCPRCETVKPVTAFSVDRNRKSGRNCYCLECTRRTNRASYSRNFEGGKARKAAAYKRDREKFLARNRRWRADNYERELETNRKYYHDNKAQVRAWHKRYYEANKDAAFAASQRRRARMRSAATAPFSMDDLRMKWRYWGNRCWICGGNPTATDHVKPLSKGGAHMLCNLRPICKPCNSAKHDKWPYQRPIPADTSEDVAS